MKTTTRTFKSGNSIAVRIPRQFNLEAGKTLEIQQRGKELILVETEESLAGLIDILQSFPADFYAGGRHDTPPQERDFSNWLEPAIKTRLSSAVKKSTAIPIATKKKTTSRR